MAKAKKSAIKKGTNVAASGGDSARGSATAAGVRAALAKLGKAALQRKFRDVFGRTPKSDNVHHLREALAKKLATPQPAPIAAIARAVPVRERDARLPAVGTVLERPYKGVTHKVKVLEDAFEYGGQRLRSLSAIARMITGQQTNGFLWFGLIARPDAPAKAAPTDTKGKA